MYLNDEASSSAHYGVVYIETPSHAQVDGVSLIFQSYLKSKASLNSLLFRVKSPHL